MSVSQEDYDDFVHYSSARSAELRTAHDELEKHVLELANLVMDQQKVLAELTKHLIALAQEKETDNEVR
tara:strand:- start:517 stop:723 length:207 start_codon:yes stop_codon:yes gene_type:complete